MIDKIMDLLSKRAELTMEFKKLKAEGSREFCLCTGPIGGCLQMSHNEWESSRCGGDWYDYTGFEDWYLSDVDEGKICEHCQKARQLKRERGVIGKKLGHVNSQLTVIGKSILKSRNENNF